jgi:O-antigen/teichoic acid export membrane protein
MVTTVMGAVAGVVMLGGDTTLARFWFLVEVDARRWRVTTAWIAALLALATTACLALAPLAPWLAEQTLGGSGNAPLYWLALMSIPLAQSSRLINQVLRNEYRVWPSAVTAMALGALTFTFGVVSVALLRLGVAGVLVGVILAEAAVLGLRVLLARRVLSRGLDRSMLGEMVRFAIPLVPVTLTFWLLTASSRVILGSVSGLDALAVYGVASTVAAGFVVITGAVSQAWVPRAFNLYETDRGQAAAAIGRFLTIYVLILGGVAVALAVLAPEFVSLLAPSEFSDAAVLIPIVSLGAVAFGAQLVTSAGLTLTRRTGTLAWLSVVAAGATIVLSLALIPPAGALGASVAATLGYVLLAVVYFAASQRAWTVTVDWWALSLTIGALVLSLLASVLMVDGPLSARAIPLLAYAAFGLVMWRYAPALRGRHAVDHRSSDGPSSPTR